MINQVSRQRINTNWSIKLAYAVGLIATDGCLSKDGRHIDFTSKDIALIRTFQDCLGLEDIKIGIKNNGAGVKCFRIQFGDVLFYRWLQEIGLTPKKSKTIGQLAIPDIFFFDFLRGSFDGDGSIYAFWDPRWRSSYMFYLQFASASLAHLQWLQATISRLGNVDGKIKQSTRCHLLVYAKKTTRILLKNMFYSDDIPHLSRKLVKAQKILTIDSEHK